MQRRTFSAGFAVALFSLAGAVSVLAAALWKTDAKQSSVSFVGTQAGAEFTGVFQTFKADIQFDPKDLKTSRFNVLIDLKSINSKEKERDDIIRGPDIFATDRWPQARYVAEEFTDLGGGKYSAKGKLTLRDATREVPIEFTFQSDASGAWLKGGAKLKRLDFGVGQGDWKDTQWVGNDVRVQFALRLLP